jgi:predicted RNA-binding protein (virulence factor B family)
MLAATMTETICLNWRIAYMEQYKLLRAWKYYLPFSDKTIPQDLKDVFKNILAKKI